VSRTGPNPAAPIAPVRLRPSIAQTRLQIKERVHVVISSHTDSIPTLACPLLYLQAVDGIAEKEVHPSDEFVTLHYEQIIEIIDRWEKMLIDDFGSEHENTIAESIQSLANLLLLLRILAL
jgi:hypothetical protein